MLVTAAEVADSLALLVPGFVLMKVFYLLGFQTRRSDLEWVIWSILATAPLVALTSALLGGGADWRAFPVELFLGLAAGGALAIVWRAISQIAPQLKAEMTIRAWDLLASPQWLLVELNDGRRFRGWPRYVTRSVDTDDADMYLADPAAEHDGKFVPLANVDGILIKRSDIALVAAFKRSQPQAAETPGRKGRV